MRMHFGRLTLRDFFWFVLLAAIGVGWYLERSQATQHIAELSKRWPFGLPSNPQPSPAFQQRQQQLAAFRALDNAELNKIFSALKPASLYHASDEYQCALIEMSRRKMHEELQDHYRRLQVYLSPNQSETPANALLLTALRRAQGKPDPVEVQVRVAHPASRAVDAANGPVLHVNLKNSDDTEITLQRGGDYRSGRQTRWRVQLTNEKGEQLRDSNFPPNLIGGGISQYVALQPGESLYKEGNQLDPRHYVKAPPSGRYQLQVIYAEQEIADQPNLDGLILWKSRPIDVMVDTQEPAEMQRISAMPLLAVLLGGVIIFATASVIRRRQRTQVEGSARRRYAKDYVAITLLILATVGWVIDGQRLKRVIERLRPDQTAQWTLRALSS